MGDAQDYNPYVGEIWDPTLKKNVYLGSQSPTQYITGNWDRYKDYGGAVTHIGSTPIHSEAFTGAPTTASAAKYPKPPSPKGPKGPTPQPSYDPIKYRSAYERQAMNPYGQDQEYGQLQKQVAEQVRIVPGVRPNFGYMPGYGGFNLQSYQPLDWGSRQKNSTPDEIEKRLIQKASSGNFNLPTLKSVSWDQGKNPAEMFSNRGFQYGGKASDRELFLTQQFLAGRPINMNELSRLRMSRVEKKQKSDFQKIVDQYYAPLLMTIMTAGLGAAAAPAIAAGASAIPYAAAGAGLGAFGAGAMSRWRDPWAVALGAAGGAAGGWGGGAAASALGATSPVVTGAASGAGSAIGSSTGRAAATGEFDPKRFAVDVGIGAGTGGATGYFTPPGPPSSPGGRPTPNPYAPVVGTGFGLAGKTVRDLLWDDDENNPYRRRMEGR